MNENKLHQLEKYIVPGSRAHLVGIGGVSMAPLAEVLCGMGVSVTGSDMNDSAAVKKLRGLGISVSVGHAAENISGAQYIIRTAAARDDNPEIAAALQAGVPVFERAEAWGLLMRGYKNAVCIAGTHGKTTTTSMFTHIMMAADSDPTVMIGGTLPLLGAAHRVGRGDTIVLESCEYYDSFLSFFPTIAVILNVDADHLDYFADLDAVKASFRNFARLVPENGTVVANAGDKNTLDAISGIGRNVLTFSVDAPADVTCRDLQICGGRTKFDIIFRGEVYAAVELKVPGRHNVANALAAAAAAIAAGVPGSAVEAGLGAFTGASRRFQYKGSCAGADIYDDYAHHPKELSALLDAVAQLGSRRVILAFQPHTYSRTKAHFDDFARQLSRADAVLLAEIYAAREENIYGISSADLAAEIPGAEYFADFESLARRISAIARPGDLILTVGAGDIYKVGEMLAALAE